MQLLRLLLRCEERTVFWVGHDPMSSRANPAKEPKDAILCCAGSRPFNSLLAYGVHASIAGRRCSCSCPANMRSGLSWLCTINS